MVAKGAQIKINPVGDDITFRTVRLAEVGTKPLSQEDWEGLTIETKAKARINRYILVEVCCDGRRSEYDDRTLGAPGAFENKNELNGGPFLMPAKLSFKLPDGASANDYLDALIEAGIDEPIGIGVVRVSLPSWFRIKRWTP